MPTASEIIERVKARYAGCRTYEDEGEHTLRVRRGAEPSKTAHFRFLCAFIRGIAEQDLVHFQMWSVENGRLGTLLHAVWQNRLGTFCENAMGTQRIESVGHGMRAGAGFSDMPAQTLGLLTPARDVLPWRAFGFVPDCVADEVAADVRCYRLDGRWGNWRTTIWCERESLTMRRAESTRAAPPLTIEETTVWHPRMDHDIDPKVFEFEPPG